MTSFSSGVFAARPGAHTHGWLLDFSFGIQPFLVCFTGAFWFIDVHCSATSPLYPPFTLTHPTWTTSMGHNLAPRFGLQLFVDTDTILGWSTLLNGTLQQASRTRGRGLPSLTTSRITLVCGHSGRGKEGGGSDRDQVWGWLATRFV
jgi:hypothetical protein